MHHELYVFRIEWHIKVALLMHVRLSWVSFLQKVASFGHTWSPRCAEPRACAHTCGGDAATLPGDWGRLHPGPWGHNANKWHPHLQGTRGATINSEVWQTGIETGQMQWPKEQYSSYTHKTNAHIITDWHMGSSHKLQSVIFAWLCSPCWCYCNI